MFRTAHTIKGSAGMLGLAMLVRFAHAMENMLERLRSGEIALDEHLHQPAAGLQRSTARPAAGGRTQPRAATDRDPADPGPALPAARAPDPAQPAADHAGSRTGQSDGSARLAPLPALLSRPLSGRFRSAGLHPLPSATWGDPRHPASLAGVAPAATARCHRVFSRLRDYLLSAEPAERIRSTFDFVAHASLICLLSPHQDLAQFSEQGQKLAAWCNEPLAAQLQRWVQAGALSEEEAACIARGELTPGAASAEPALAPPPRQPSRRRRPPHSRPDPHRYGRRGTTSASTRSTDQSGRRAAIATSATTLQARMRGEMRSSSNQ